MSDKGLGIIIIVFSILFMIGYFVWAFAPLIGLSQWITEDISEWAFKLPIVVAIYIILILILWVGYTMATTPPPMPLEKPLEIEREKASGIDEKRDEKA